MRQHREERRGEGERRRGKERRREGRGGEERRAVERRGRITDIRSAKADRRQCLMSLQKAKRKHITLPGPARAHTHTHTQKMPFLQKNSVCVHPVHYPRIHLRVCALDGGTLLYIMWMGDASMCKYTSLLRAKTHTHTNTWRAQQTAEGKTERTTNTNIQES